MIRFTVTETLPHPPEVVLDALADARRHPEWMPGVQTVEVDDGGDPGDSTAWTERRTRFGREMRERYRIAERDPNRLVLEVEGGEDSARRGRWRFAYAAEAVPEGTRLTVEGGGEGLGTVGRVAGRFAVAPFRRAVEEDLEALRSWLAEGDH